MALIDFNDIQAQENRRREVAVKAGASPRATKYEHSPLKEMLQELVEEATPAVADKLADYQKNTPLPGYNFVSTGLAFKTVEDTIKDSKEAIKVAQDEAKNNEKLQKEARENEMKITRTSTGQPKVENGENVETLQEPTDPDKAVHNVVTPETTPKTAVNPNPSPVGSGDPRAAAAPKDNK